MKNKNGRRVRRAATGIFETILLVSDKTQKRRAIYLERLGEGGIKKPKYPKDAAQTLTAFELKHY